MIREPADITRFLTLLRRDAGADPVASDVLTYQGPNQAQWATPTAAWHLTVMVGANGADYTTIQGALDANATANMLVLVLPGTYANDTINFTANDQCIRGMGANIEQHEVTNTAQICDFGAYTNCFIQNIKMTGTYTSAINMITGTGSCKLWKTHLVTNVSGTIADSPTILNHTGTVEIDHSTIDYANTSNRGAGYKYAFYANSASETNLTHCDINSSGSGTSTAHAVALSEGTGVFNSILCEVDITDNVTTWALAFATINGEGVDEFYYNNIHVNNSTNNAVALYMDSNGSTLSFRSMYNHIHAVAAGGSARSFLTANEASITLVTQFDDVIAANGISKGAASTIEYVYSEADGDLDLSGSLTAGYLHFLERSSDPTEPAEGECVIWMSDGTGKGDDGDIMIASQAGGTTNYGTLFDHSGGAGW